MPFEITMPQLGLTMEQGTVAEWLIAEGDPISAGQEILHVETDKAVVSVEAHQGGILARILIPQGQEVPVGTVLALGVAPGEALPVKPSPPAQPVAPEAAPTLTPEPVPQPVLAPVAPDQRPFQASWKARTLARDAGLDLHGVVGSGPNGRIVAQDVSQALALRLAARSGEARATPVAVKMAAALGLDLACVTGSGDQGRVTQQDVLAAAAAIIQRQAAGPAAPPPGLPQVASTTPLKGARKIVSEGMAASAQATARVTLFREVDATGLIALRERFVAQSVRISYNDILVQICGVALREHPAANARLGSGQIEHLDRVNVGLAVDTERGLLVPVVRNADRLSLRQIAAESARLVEAARTGRSLPDDLCGGTFTITNLGMLGVESFTPVINLPECCILGVGRIVRKPVALAGDTVAVRPMMTLSLVFDHRVIDGAPAARFLDRIAGLVQDPLLLLTIDERPRN